MSFAMSGREKRVFGLDHSLHTSIFQVKVNCTSREGLVGDVGKCFGYLNSIFSFSRGDQVLSMANVGGGKLGWMPSN